MELKSRQIVEVFELKNGKYAICLISIAPRNVVYYHKQKKPYKSYRWMCDEHWAAFDNIIESLNPNDCNDIEKRVDLSPVVYMKIQSINSGVGKLCQIIHDIKDLKANHVLALKCEIKYKEHAKEDEEVGEMVKSNEETNFSCNETKNYSKRSKENGNTDTFKPDEDLDQQIVCFRISSQDLNSSTPVNSSVKKNTSNRSIKHDTTQHEENDSIKIYSEQSKATSVKSPAEHEPSSPIRQRRITSKPKRYTEFQTEFLTPLKRRGHSPKTDCSDSPVEEQLLSKRSRKLNSACKLSLQKANETPQRSEKFGSPSSKKIINRNKNKSLSNKEYQKSMQELIEDLVPPSPPRVQYLSLNDMTVDKIMSTLREIKPQLDSLFKDVSHKNFIKSYGGINHFLVISLISDKIKAEMMKKLGELYEIDETPKYGSHFINVLMPEWILSLFMKRYKMNREDAIKHLKAQNAQDFHITGM